MNSQIEGFVNAAVQYHISLGKVPVMQIKGRWADMRTGTEVESLMNTFDVHDLRTQIAHDVSRMEGAHMDYEVYEALQRELDRMNDPSLEQPDFGTITGTVVGHTPIVTEQDGEIYAYDMPIYADWCE